MSLTVGRTNLKPMLISPRPMVANTGCLETRLIVSALQSDAACAAYREALKNVMRSHPSERVEIARKALFGQKVIKQRGRAMLKVVKAAVIAVNRLRHGNAEDFAGAVAALEAALDKFELKGATARKWLKEK